MADFDQVTKAHGIVGSVAWVIFLPLGAILVRVVDSPYTWLLHAAVQAFGLILVTAGFGQGIWMALTGMFSLSDYHPAIGIVVFALVWTQPITGLTHHLLFKKIGKRTIISHLHIWLGRSLITLGMLQGGLGILYADGDATRAENIAYGVIAGVIWLTYVLIVVFELGIKKKGPPEMVGKALIEKRDSDDSINVEGAQ